MARVFQIDRLPEFVDFELERGLLGEAGAELVVADCAEPDDVVAGAAGADVLWIAWKPQVTGALLDALPQCRLVVRWGVGYEQIDVSAATERGVAVANAPTYATADVAEHTVALILSVARRIPWLHERVRAGAWPTSDARLIHRARGRTLGLVGLGRIGLAVARLACGLGMRVVAFDPARRPADVGDTGVELVTEDELLAQADVISLHVPLNKGNAHLVDADLLARVKPGAVLINTSRGRVVDESALLEALDRGRLAAAALDVFAEEPLPEGSPLRAHPNIVLTPHVAGLSEEAWHDLRTEMCSTTIEWLATGRAATIVNPDVFESGRS